MLAIGTYTGPALALVGETALLRIKLGVVIAAKFCAMETGLGLVWRRFEGGSFAVLARERERPPAKPVTVPKDLMATNPDHDSSDNGRDGLYDPPRAVRELSGAGDTNNGTAAAA